MVVDLKVQGEQPAGYMEIQSNLLTVTWRYLQDDLASGDCPDPALGGAGAAPGEVEVPHCHLAHVVAVDHVAQPVNKHQGRLVQSCQSSTVVLLLHFYQDLHNGEINILVRIEEEVRHYLNIC